MQFLNLSDNEFKSSLTSIVVTFDVKSAELYYVARKENCICLSTILPHASTLCCKCNRVLVKRLP
jgi:hypothetical protein